MTDRETTIKRLQILRTWCAVNPDYGMGLDSGDCAKAVGWLDDALALMRAREPCLLTWDELIAIDHVYIETNKDGQKYIAPGIVTIARDTAVIASVRIGTRLIDCTIDKDVYGIECRCWTSRPDQATREATPWLT